MVVFDHSGHGFNPLAFGAEVAPRLAPPYAYAMTPAMKATVPKGVKDINKLVEDGFDPIHAAYVAAQNLVSVFAENVSTLDELEQYYNIVADPAQ